MFMAASGDTFQAGCDPIEVTSRHRPDTGWKLTDQRGHVHQWYADGAPAARYDPLAHHETPTLVWVKDGEEYWEDDDEPHDVGHLECRLCGEHVSPRYTEDTTRVFIPGLRWYRINGEPVSPEEFKRRVDLLK